MNAQSGDVFIGTSTNTEAKVYGRIKFTVDGLRHLQDQLREFKYELTRKVWNRYTSTCALSYEAIAKEILKKNPEADRHPFYGEWVSGYASAEYHMENERLTSLMNRLTADYTPAQIERLIDIFTACSRYEMSFWDMAWEMRQ